MPIPTPNNSAAEGHVPPNTSWQKLGLLIVCGNNTAGEAIRQPIRIANITRAVITFAIILNTSFFTNDSAQTAAPLSKAHFGKKYESSPIGSGKLHKSRVSRYLSSRGSKATVAISLNINTRLLRRLTPRNDLVNIFLPKVSLLKDHFPYYYFVLCDCRNYKKR